MLQSRMTPIVTGVLPRATTGGYDPAKKAEILRWWQIDAEADGTVHGDPLHRSPAHR